MEVSENSECGVKDKICLVCGDKALGYNFNALTCESCKAFFRRNALKNKEFKCPFDKKCNINTITRRFCQLCRLLKCFEVGMKKEYIMSENDKIEKRKKIEQKRTGRINNVNAEESTNLGDEKSPKRSKTEHVTDAKLNPPYLKKIILRRSYEEGQIEAEEEVSCYREDAVFHRTEPSHLVNEPFSSPLMPEPSSPVGSAVEENRLSNRYDSNRSRSAEIYQMSKISEAIVPGPSQRIHYAPSESPRVKPSFKTGYADTSIIKNILRTDQTAESHSEAIDCRVFDRPHDDSFSPPPRPMPLLASLVGNSSDLPPPRPKHTFRADVADEVLRDIPRKSHLDLGSSIESILTEAIKLEYEAYSSMNPKINSRELNDAERAKLNELIVANKALLAPLEDDVTSDITQDVMSKSNLGLRPMLLDVLNLTAIAIRRLIKMSKKVNAFKNMCQEDQVALLKGGCTEMMILRSAMTYDSDRGSWKIPHSKERLMNIKVDVLKEAGGRVFEEHQRFLQTFDPRWRNDENIMLILSAITLFTPDRPRVVHYDVIKLEQNSYYYLLRRYLESIYPGCEARSTFLKLIHKISELHRLNEDHVRVYMELNPEDVEPLLIEIFDLNPH